MKTTPDLDRVFPLSGGSSERPALRAPRLPSLIKNLPGIVTGHRAFLRPWTVRRASAGGMPLSPGL
ncbi:MAG: hypothetical protein EXS37_12965 [Opitutus sp.]|nr:hypothetical protein [Opitutus sp.]